MVNFTDLPKELLVIIIEYFDSVADALGFNLICENCANVVNNDLEYRIRAGFAIPKRFSNITNLYVDFWWNISNGYNNKLIHFKDMLLLHLDIAESYNSIKKLSKLKILNIYYAEEFSDSMLVNLTELVTLKINNNLIISDKSLSKLTKLETLSLGDNEIITFAAISKLPKLTSLNTGNRENIMAKGYYIYARHLKYQILYVKICGNYHLVMTIKLMII
jgi:hypothetical protein